MRANQVDSAVPFRTYAGGVHPRQAYSQTNLVRQHFPPAFQALDLERQASQPVAMNRRRADTG